MLGLILGGIAAVAGLFGAAKAVEAKSTNDDAKRIISNAKERHESTKNDLDNIQQETSDTLIKLGETKIETWDNHLQYFVSTINRVKPVVSKVGLVMRPVISDGFDTDAWLALCW